MATLAAALPRVDARPRAIAGWLLGIAALVFAMVVVGGITRLTESGLSITRWDVVSGTLPPLTEAEWQHQFALYQQSSQYQLMNRGMSLAAFKGIFFWEYVHRLLGRLVGLAFALPLAWFWLKRQIPAGYKPRLLALFALGGLQGAIGWWMVASGLVDRTEVAPERLAVHLSNALIIMAGCIWTALDLLDGDRPRHDRPRAWVWPVAALLAVQILWGAFTAGLRAGHASDTWPLMFGALVPDGILASARDAIADPVSVQFLHRSLAWAVAAAILLVALRLWQAGAGVRALALGGLVLLQFALGVLVIINHVPIPLGVAHQGVAALLVGATVWAAHWSKRGRQAGGRA
ncbi:heme A synthase [Sandarakinorhabdus cyanobacteriorum]|uniref:Heme A synthase n=1 Tax=Sandarakinorhabdus cyanobacteriorum TaxID=1981098 RepID=A0A255Y6G5_9SPHN|nr:COX15/CtaA family protein [Sandarakinorhabdus cyanobacteriorum]OYQ24763.1 heme A synthase [Sandarakinorhabdus cyanobacteriorum]